MPTKISTLYENRSFSKDTIEPFYCKENPMEVLRTLVPNHHVRETCGLRTNMAVLYKPKGFSINGLSISSTENNSGLTINGKLKDFSTKIPPISEKGKIMIVSGLVGEYLIDKKIENYSSSIYSGKRHISGDPKIINYFEERKKEINPTKERNLAIIWEWAKALNFGEFDFNKLEEIAFRHSERLGKMSAQDITNFGRILF